MIAAVIALVLSMCPHLTGGCPQKPDRPVPRDISPDPAPTKPPQE